MGDNKSQPSIVSKHHAIGMCLCSNVLMSGRRCRQTSDLPCFLSMGKKSADDKGSQREGERVGTFFSADTPDGRNCRRACLPSHTLQVVQEVQHNSAFSKIADFGMHLHVKTLIAVIIWTENNERVLNTWVGFSRRQQSIVFMECLGYESNRS